jgi:hypothetical protein
VVGVAADLVAKPLRLPRTRLRDRRLAPQLVHQAPDDEPHDQLDSERDGDVPEVEVGRTEAIGTRPLGEDEERRRREGEDDPASDRVANRRLDDGEEDERARRDRRLERVENEVGEDDSRVEGERAEAEGCLPTALEAAPREPREPDRADSEHRGRRPGVALVARRVAVRHDRDLEDGPGDRPEPDPGDPDLELAQPLLLARHPDALVSRRASAHRACSRRSSSSHSA